jgi:hypothetical protein
MNLSIFWRLVWKEYRLQRPLWIAMAVLMVLVQLLVLALVTSPHDKLTSLYMIAVALPGFFALGCGATLFAGEREAGTFHWQRSLPVWSLSVFWAKIGTAIVGIAILWGLGIWLATTLQNPEGIETTWAWRGTTWAIFGVFGMEMFVWAVLFSLLSKRVLLAAILGVAAASIACHATAGGFGHQITTDTYRDAWQTRIVVSVVVLLIDFLIAAFWFCEKQQKQPRSALSSLSETPAVSGFSARFQGPRWLAMLGRLVWQHWRQSRRLAICILVLLIPMMAIMTVGLTKIFSCPVALFDLGLGRASSGDERLLHLMFLMQAGLVVAMPPLLGVVTFLADQRGNSYRFFADRGVSPRLVWLSRQLVTFGLPMLVAFVLLLAALALVAIFFQRPENLVGVRWPGAAEAALGVGVFCRAILAAFGYVILGIAAGQFCSMCFRSPILAGLFSLIISVVLAGWSLLMLVWQVNWYWSILPIPLALLLATRLRAADWLAERNGLRAWLRPGLTLLASATTLLIVVPLYRVHQIPLVDPGFSPSELARPLEAEDQTTLAMYDEACRTLQWVSGHDVLQNGRQFTAPTDPEIKWVSENSKAIQAGLEASRRPIGNLAGCFRLPSKWHLAEVARLLLCSAVVNQDKGKLDVALEQYLGAARIAVLIRRCYPISILQFSQDDYRMSRIENQVYEQLPGWAARPGQTPERILAAVKQLEQITAGFSPSDPLKLAYLQVRQFLSGDLNIANQVDGPSGGVPPWTVLWMQLPWERQRALRLLNRSVRGELDYLAFIEGRLQKGEGVAEYLPHRTRYQPEFRSTPYSLTRTVHIPPVFFDPRTSTERIVADHVSIVTARRGVQLVLALEAWKLKHGSLPKKLEELVGHGLERLPIDPYAGTPFLYRPAGLPIPLPWSLSGTVFANVPFVWASGADLRRTNLPHDSDSVYGYEVFSELSFSGNPYYRPRSQYEIWQSGWPFPIP